ncbi:MAG: signal peptidase I [Nitrospinota bacterium]|nr:MAG: signal peptidase I [Nitrospinota bacterium]
MEEKKKSVYREYIESIVIAVVLALLIRTFVVQAFKIPSGSMIPTLLIGDHILVNKFAYGVKVPFTDYRFHFFGLLDTVPQRGDIIVFLFPQDPSRDFIKRVIGLPNEQVEIRDKRVYINGELLEEPYAIYEDTTIQPKDLSPRDNYGPVIVPAGHLFMMGDNRDNSMDSRFWGFLDIRKIKGKAFMVYWSWNGSKPVRQACYNLTRSFPWLVRAPAAWSCQIVERIRWDRIGKLLH